MKKRYLEDMLYQKLLLGHEKRLRQTKFGLKNLFNYQTNIEASDTQDLLSSLFEIDEVNQEELKLDQDLESIEDFTHTFENLFTLKFLEKPSEEIKQQLKKRNFFFNSFRNEYYGRDNKSEIEELLKECPFKLEKFFP
jgi:hypothetical protein